MKKLGIVLGSLAGILFIIFMVMSFVVPKTTLSESEKKKAVEQILGHKLTEATPTGSAKDFASADFSLTMPAGSSLYTFEQDQIEKSPGYLSGVRFQAQMPKYLFVIRVEKAEGKVKLDDLPAVRLRRNQKDLYTESALTLAGKPGIVFSKDQPADAEKTAFVLYNGKVYSCAISGLQFSELTPVFGQVIESVQIK